MGGHDALLGAAQGLVRIGKAPFEPLLNHVDVAQLGNELRLTSGMALVRSGKIGGPLLLSPACRREALVHPQFELIARTSDSSDFDGRPRPLLRELVVERR